ncbi:MAG TPA: tautomerase family protein [Anaeromyxobacteraceae bacterium]|nr:tautomerase family protein [Anaeromyxobacteraceae bacterium]
MPHLRFDLNFAASPEEKSRFAAAVVRNFASIMDTGTDHIAVALQCREPGDLVFGRSAAGGGRTVLLDADIRLGRSRDQKRRLALAIVSEVQGTWGVAPEGVYVVYTEHDGENFQLSDRVLPSWSEGEDPLADRPRRPRRPAAARRRQARSGRGAGRRRGRR